jgi:hypothetical protein
MDRLTTDLQGMFLDKVANSQQNYLKQIQSASSSASGASAQAAISAIKDVEKAGKSAG